MAALVSARKGSTVEGLDSLQQRNRAEQSRLYGATVGELVDELTGAYAVSRGQLAAVLGLSAPMLSQLATARRMKIGNPEAVQRVQRLLADLDAVRSGELVAATVLAEVERMQGGQMLTRTSMTQRRGASDVRDVLLSAATPQEVAAAADSIEADHPKLAEVLRLYAVVGGEDCARHFAQVRRS